MTLPPESAAKRVAALQDAAQSNKGLMRMVETFSGSLSNYRQRENIPHGLTGLRVDKYLRWQPDCASMKFLRGTS